jgi:hypothetical protein
MKLTTAMLFIVLSITGILTAQDMNLTGAGARAEGIGGAFIGVADDATAIVWNPAGLVQLERPEASVVTRFISEKESYNYTYTPSSNTSLSQSHLAFNFGSFALPFKLGSTSVVVAAAYQRQIDLYSNEKMASNEVEGKGGVDTFTPGISVKLSPILSVGVAANIWTGSSDLTQKIAQTYYQPASTVSQSLSYKGFNLVIGGMVDLEALPERVPLKLGMTVRTPFDMTADGSQNYSGDVPVTLNASRTIQMPLMIGFGSSFHFTENFIMAVDYEIRSYGDRQYTDVLTGSGPSQTMTSNLSASKENLNQFRIGAEYLIVSKKSVIPIRIGYKTMPTLNANYDSFGNIADQVKGKAITLGSGYIANAFAIDVSYTAADYSQTFAGQGTIDYTVGTVGASVIIYF